MNRIKDIQEELNDPLLCARIEVVGRDPKSNVGLQERYEKALEYKRWRESYVPDVKPVKRKKR